METITVTTDSTNAQSPAVEPYRSALSFYEVEAARTELTGFHEAITRPLLKRGVVHMSPAGEFFVKASDGAFIGLKAAAIAARSEANAAAERRRVALEQQTVASSTRLMPVDVQAAWFALPTASRAFFLAAARTDDAAERELFVKIGKIFKSGANVEATAAVLALAGIA